MKGRRVPVKLAHTHVWVAARVPGVAAVTCSCGALVQVEAQEFQSGVRFRFRCLQGTDHLVADADFPRLATSLGLLGPDAVYAGKPRAVAA
jgi:hypothetical protein